MISRRGSIIRAMVVFGSIGAAALVWSFSVLNQERIGGSVEIQQLKEPAWDVQISEVSADAAATTASAR